MVRSDEAFNFTLSLCRHDCSCRRDGIPAGSHQQLASLFVTALTYGLSTTFFSPPVRCITHSRSRTMNCHSRRMDRFAIFIMIAGSYTPVCYFFRNDDGGYR